MDDRIMELETKFSFQEDTLREMNEVLIRQQRELDRQQEQLSRLQSQLAELLATQGDQGQAGNEKPPHY